MLLFVWVLFDLCLWLGLFSLVCLPGLLVLIVCLGDLILSFDERLLLVWLCLFLFVVLVFVSFVFACVGLLFCVSVVWLVSVLLLMLVLIVFVYTLFLFGFDFVCWFAIRGWLFRLLVWFDGCY